MQSKVYMVYVEDDEDDLLLMEEIMLKQKEVDLVAVGDGQELMEFLEDQRDGDLPCLVVMDNNTPRLSGIETARKIKSDQQFSHLKLILLTTSLSKADKDFCAENNILEITKPSTYADWEALTKSFVDRCRAGGKIV